MLCMPKMRGCNRLMPDLRSTSAASVEVPWNRERKRREEWYEVRQTRRERVSSKGLLIVGIDSNIRTYNDIYLLGRLPSNPGICIWYILYIQNKIPIPMSWETRNDLQRDRVLYREVPSFTRSTAALLRRTGWYQPDRHDVWLGVVIRGYNVVLKCW